MTRRKRWREISMVYLVYFCVLTQEHIDVMPPALKASPGGGLYKTLAW